MLEDVKDVLIWSPQPQPPLSQEDEATHPSGYNSIPTVTTIPVKQCCGSVMFVPDPNFCHPGSQICITEFKVPVFFTQKIVSKLSEI